MLLEVLKVLIANLKWLVSVKWVGLRDGGYIQPFPTHALSVLLQLLKALVHDGYGDQALYPVFQWR